jgi:UDP-glucose 4-epimerase
MRPVVGRSVLITGGAGFIGSHLADAFLERGWRVAVVDDLSTGRRENLPAGVTLYERDIAEPGALEDVFDAARPEVVSHHAAQTSVRLSASDPVFDLRANVLGTLNLIMESLRRKVGFFSFASTGGAIYGDGVPLPTPEGAPASPASPYGVAKLGAEHYLEWAGRAHGLPTLRLRYANVYGPRQDPRGEAGVVAIFSRLMLGGGQPVINGDGGQTRDYVCVKDVVEANLAGVEKGLTGTYNVGTGRETDVNALFGSLAEITGFRGEKRYGPAKPGEQERSSLDSSLLRRECGWSPSTDLRRGLEETTEWFRENDGVS